MYNNRNRKEINKNISFRIETIEKYLNSLLTQKESADKLGITERHLRRIIKKYKELGAKALIHGLHDRISNNAINKETKEKILTLIEKKYRDANPTLLVEVLEKKENIKINTETLRLWMRKDHLQPKKRRRSHFRQKRERKEFFGEMLQIDGTFHEWFISPGITEKEDRKACLLNLIDDSISINLILFDKQETMKCACLLLWKWINKYGIPQSIYCDRRNMYIAENDKRKDNLISENKNKGKRVKGFFRTICDNLNITIIPAGSAQAKGRVERSNETHQDRLTKLMSIENIKTIEEANEYIEKEYIDNHNNKFSVKSDNIIDVHKKLEENITLNDICYMEETRKVNNDWTISFRGEWYQLKRESQYYPPTKNTVYVRMYLDGNVDVFYRNHPIKYTVINRSK
jgi:transposase